MAKRAPELYHAYVGQFLTGPDDIPTNSNSTQLPAEQYPGNTNTKAHTMLEAMRKIDRQLRASGRFHWYYIYIFMLIRQIGTARTSMLSLH